MFTKKTMDELERKSAAEAKHLHQHNIIIILDDVRSMHNVGSAFRTADAMSVAAIYLCGYTPIPPHRDIHKTALGATETVKWQHFMSTTDAIMDAKKNGYTVYAVEQTHNSTELQQLDWNISAPIALVFGNEVSGVSDEALALVEGCIEIPQWGAKHSFNISVSIGIVLWEIVRSAQ
jgi:tRNA G18 (ribose-2'-O)-methylase SpoU